jgi:hypothetical protein
MTKPWKDHKANILRLYIDEGRTLANVRTIMERDYGFDASIRSYRQHFDDWNVGKYNCRRRQSRHQIGSSPESSPPLRSAMPTRRQPEGGNYVLDRSFGPDTVHPHIKQEMLPSIADDEYRTGPNMSSYPSDSHSGYRLMPPRDNAMMRQGPWAHPDWQVPRSFQGRPSGLEMPHGPQYPTNFASSTMSPSSSPTQRGSVYSYGCPPTTNQHHHHSPTAAFHQAREFFDADDTRGFADARGERLPIVADGGYRGGHSYGWAVRDVEV